MSAGEALLQPQARALLDQGLLALGRPLPPEARERLLAYAAELLRWNERLNLTAITAPAAVVDRHLLDSLAVVPEVEGAASLLDLGSGAGLPGVPLAVALPALPATLVDAVAKKVSFLKVAVVKAGLTGRVKAVHARLAGQPAREGVAPAEVVVSRAFLEVGAFLDLARAYLAPGGRVVALLGPGAGGEAALGAAAAAHRFTLRSFRAFALPLSGDPRAVATFTAG